MRTALVVGATGLVGGCLLERLTREPTWGRIVAVGRRPAGRSGVEDHLIDFDRLGGADLPAADDLFCALGTTIRTARTQERFRRVDLDYVVELAEAVHAAGARQALLVSSIGADAASGNFYLSVKGQAEESVRELGFDSVQIFRPSLLLGARSESRPLERLGQIGGRLVAPLMRGPLERYRAVPAETLAAAMVAAAREPRPGLTVHTHRDFRRLLTV